MDTILSTQIQSNIALNSQSHLDSRFVLKPSFQIDKTLEQRYNDFLHISPHQLHNIPSIEQNIQYFEHI